MGIRKIQRELPAKETFTFTDKTVQSARLGKNGDSLYVCSPKRFKLFAAGSETLCIVCGEGYIKWARGELRFGAGDCFAAENCGEYEVNGACEFAVLRGQTGEV